MTTAGGETKGAGMRSCATRKKASGLRPELQVEETGGELADAKLLFGREEFFVDGGDDYVVGVDHFGEVETADFGEEFVGVEFREGVVALNPANDSGDADADA